jgi:ferric-dicitrate binding protein FerR (iron transport regulator)
MDRIGPLFDAYVEGDLSPLERETLCAGLRQSDALVDDFVRESFLHAELTSLLREKSLRHSVLSLPGCQADEPWMTSVPRPSPDAARGRFASRRLPKVALALAVCFVVLATLLWNYRRTQTVAQLTQTTPGAVWAAHQGLKQGTLLRYGEELRIDHGRALVTMVSGARIILEGPSTLRLEGDNAVRLERGRIGATVPPEATGFTVATTLGEFVDLGTDFSLDLTAPTRCELQVFSGLVEVRPARQARPNLPFKVPQTRAISYDATTGEAKRITYSDERKLSL